MHSRIIYCYAISILILLHCAIYMKDGATKKMKKTEKGKEINKRK
jgi:hypothetical protein